MPRYHASANEIKTEYFQWLCELIHVETGGASYWLLMKDLHSKEFTSGVITNDDNRAMDGMQLREEYIVDSPYIDGPDIEGPCSMLEMLIALARRIDFELSTPDDTRDLTPSYFWEMIENLGLMAYSDDVYISLNGMFEVNNVVSMFLAREYKKNGRGGLFPLKKSKEDQRGVEIWYQMNAYLMEHYY